MQPRQYSPVTLVMEVACRLTRDMLCLSCVNPCHVRFPLLYSSRINPCHVHLPLLGSSCVSGETNNLVSSLSELTHPLASLSMTSLSCRVAGYNTVVSSLPFDRFCIVFVFVQGTMQLISECNVLLSSLSYVIIDVHMPELYHHHR